MSQDTQALFPGLTHLTTPTNCHQMSQDTQALFPALTHLTTPTNCPQMSQDTQALCHQTRALPPNTSAATKHERCQHIAYTCAVGKIKLLKHCYLEANALHLLVSMFVLHFIVNSEQKRETLIGSFLLFYGLQPMRRRVCECGQQSMQGQGAGWHRQGITSSGKGSHTPRFTWRRVLHSSRCQVKGLTLLTSSSEDSHTSNFIRWRVSHSQFYQVKGLTLLTSSSKESHTPNIIRWRVSNSQIYQVKGLILLTLSGEGTHTPNFIRWILSHSQLYQVKGLTLLTLSGEGSHTPNFIRWRVSHF